MNPRSPGCRSSLTFGGVESGDVYGFPVLSVFVECVVEGSGEAGGVSDHQHSRVVGGHRADDGVEDELSYAGSFVDDDENVLVVESLESLGGVGGESVCEPFVGEFESSCGDLSADEVFVLGVDGANFAPYGFSDLSVGGSGGDDDGFIVCHEPPYGSEGGGVGFSGCVARSNGDESVFFDGVEYLLLLFPWVFVEFFLDEPDGIV